MSFFQKLNKTPRFRIYSSFVDIRHRYEMGHSITIVIQESLQIGIHLGGNLLTAWLTSTASRLEYAFATSMPSPVWPDLVNFLHFGEILKVYQCFESSFSNWHTYETTLTNFVCNWANFHWCKWPNIENHLSIWSHWPPYHIINTLSHACLLDVMARFISTYYHAYDKTGQQVVSCSTLQFHHLLKQKEGYEKHWYDPRKIWMIWRDLSLISWLRARADVNFVLLTLSNH